MIVGKPIGYTKDPIELDILAIKEDGKRTKIGTLRLAHLKNMQENIKGKEYNSMQEFSYVDINPFEDKTEVNFD